jgi:hypothetical protein
VKELQVWARGAQLVASLSTSGPHPVIADADDFDVPAATLAVGGTQSSRRFMPLVLAVILGALVVFALGWAASR